MADPESENASLQRDDDAACGALQSGLPAGMTLENIVDFTGEMEHLNELVMLHLEDTGGFTDTNAYFSVVQPILDELEGEIRMRYEPGMEKKELILIVQDWIDQEIASLQ